MPRTALITCEFTFEACHLLRREDWSEQENARVFGECARRHGHSYKLLITLRGPIDPETGMVRNFREVKQSVRERVVDRVDHNDLDAVVGGLTTAENLCHWIAGELLPVFGEALFRIELWETRTASAVLDEQELAQMRENTPPRFA